MKSISLDNLWQSAVPSASTFSFDILSEIPQPAKRYLEHAIAPGTQLASTVRLKMHGEIKLQNWSSFQAEQVINWDQGFIWQATAWVKGLPILGSDRLINGKGTMQWKLLGLFPVMTASDVTRSAIGRMQGESIWLPGVLCRPGVKWKALDEFEAEATLTRWGETTQLILNISPTGQLNSIRFQRWGHPQNNGYGNFGGYLEQESSFSGYTIPTKVRVGWDFTGDHFQGEGEFFRATIDHAIYQ
ncbi:MAG: DUF6920 family protein [Halothece sp.]